MIGKAIFEKIQIDAFLDRTLIQHILGNVITLEDIKFFDIEVKIFS